MLAKYLNYITWAIFLVLIQVFILNNIALFGYATPYLYIYLLFFIDSAVVTRNQLMIWAFVLGLLVDIGANTLGMNAASAVLLAFIRPSLLNIFCQVNDDPKTLEPSIYSMNPAGYFKYIFSGVFMHHLLLIGIEFFKVSSFSTFSLRVFSSILLTTFCIFAIERVRSK